MTILTIQVSETIEIGSSPTPQVRRDNETCPAITTGPRPASLVRRLSRPRRQKHIASLMRAIDGRSDRPVLAGVLEGVLILRILYRECALASTDVSALPEYAAGGRRGDVHGEGLCR